MMIRAVLVLPTVTEAVLSAASFMIKAAVFFFGIRFGRSLYTGKIKIREYFECAFLAAFLALISACTLGTHMENSDPIFGGGDQVEDYTPKPGQRTSHGIKVFVIVFTALAYGTSTRSRAKPFKEDRLPGPIG